MKKNHICGITFFSSFFLFTACSENINQSRDSYEELNIILDYGDSLSNVDCDSSYIGKIVFVRDSSATFYCNGDTWTLLKGSVGDKGATGEDGKDGNYGNNGKQGDTPQTPAAGPQGVQGPVGPKGENGNNSDENCFIAKDSSGTVIIQCGKKRESVLYSALCGDSAYDIHEKFCVQGKLYSSKDYLYDTRDNHIYKTVTIGEGENAVTWMAENLNYNTAESFCYGKAQVNCNQYGRLYTWAGVLDRPEDECGYAQQCDIANPFQGVCPENWHISTTREWLELFEYKKESETTGTMLMAKTSWAAGVEATDDLGFSALAAGYYNGTTFMNIGKTALFWTSDFINKYEVQTYGMEYNNTNITYDGVFKNFGLSVRCVKD